jgi:hypothetical protein
MAKPKPTPEKPNLFAVKARVRGKEPDCRAFVHFLQKLEEADFLSLDQTPQVYTRKPDSGRGKPLAPGRTPEPFADVYCDISFTYPDYPELQ